MKIDKERGVVEEKRFYYKGFPCVILFMDIGHRCGYVGIPEASGIDVEEIDCHGGITYGPSSYLHLQEDENIEWIGFDTGHYGDGRDVDKIKEYFPDKVIQFQYFNMLAGFTPKTLEYCEEECRRIVDQIIDMLGNEINKMDKNLKQDILDVCDEMIVFFSQLKSEIKLRTDEEEIVQHFEDYFKNNGEMVGRFGILINEIRYREWE